MILPGSNLDRLQRLRAAKDAERKRAARPAMERALDRTLSLAARRAALDEVHEAERSKARRNGK